jgi:hypothetical protein
MTRVAFWPFADIGVSEKPTSEPDQFARTWRESKKLLQHPLMRQTVAFLPALAFPWVRDTLICLDDIERRGQGLEIQHVFGLVSMLKEERNCRVVLIFNDSFLTSPEAGDFNRSREKLFDLELEFSPSVEEAFSYGFLSQTDLREIILLGCKDLNIRNIRTIQRIDRYWCGLRDLLRDCERSLIQEVARLLVLFVWSRNEGGDSAPPIEFIKSRTVDAIVREGRERETAEDKDRWKRLLADYGFQYMSELDCELVSYVERGYVSAALRDVLAKYDKEVRGAERRTRFFDIWKLFTGTFEDNENAFIEALENGIRSSSAYISLANLSEAVSIIRDLGRDDLANQLVDVYLETNAEEFAASDLTLSGEPDPYIVRRFEEERIRRRPVLRLDTVLPESASKNGWSPEELRCLVTSSTEDYYRVFRGESSARLKGMIDFCLRFGDSPDAEARVIAERTQEALGKIAAEGNFNRVRVKRLYRLEPGSKETGHSTQ